MSKEQNYPFWFGSLLVCFVMYCLGSNSAKENIIWESGVLVARQIFRYLNRLDNGVETCNVYFKTFLNMWSVGPVSSVTGFGDSSFRKRKRRQSVPTSIPLSKKSKKYQKEEAIIVIEDLEFPVAEGDSTVAEKKLENKMMNQICWRWLAS